MCQLIRLGVNDATTCLPPRLLCCIVCLMHECLSLDHRLVVVVLSVREESIRGSPGKSSTGTSVCVREAEAAYIPCQRLWRRSERWFEFEERANSPSPRDYRGSQTHSEFPCVCSCQRLPRLLSSDSLFCCCLSSFCTCAGVSGVHGICRLFS